MMKHQMRVIVHESYLKRRSGRRSSAPRLQLTSLGSASCCTCL
jgi:hypothetical protein